MSQCYNCGKEFTLIEGETKCDSCGKIVNFPCHNCKQWFSIEDKKQCKSCGFFTCPNCLTCGIDCPKQDWSLMIREIVVITDEQLKKLIELIEDIKIGKEKICCPNGVSISYAKGRIKSCIARGLGYRVKSEIDLRKFRERVDEVRKSEIGRKYTVNKSREAGSYGQEWRDVFNYLVCAGQLEKKKAMIDGKEYETYIRCEKGMCKMLDAERLVIKVCTNPKCTIPWFPLSQTECCYCKDKNGQFYKLKLKLNNKDICQLSRSEFKKEEKKDGETKF